MALSINNSNLALNTQATLSRTRTALADSMSRLSTLPRGEDPAKAMLARMSQQQEQQSSQQSSAANGQDGLNMANVADGALSSATDILQRLIGLATQAANGTTNESQREAIGAEFSKVKAGLEGIAKQTSFNGENLLSLSESTPASMTFRLSADGDTAEFDKSEAALYSDGNPQDGVLTRSYGDYHLLSSGNTPASSKEMNITAETTVDEAAAMVGALKGMIDGVSAARANVGAFQSELAADIGSAAIKSMSAQQSTNRSTDNDTNIDIDAAREAANQALLQMRQQMSMTILNQATGSSALKLRDLLH